MKKLYPSSLQTIHLACLLGTLGMAPISTPAATLQPGMDTYESYFGGAVGLSGTNGLVGANYYNNSGAAFLFRHLETALGLVEEDLQIPAPADAYPNFGRALTLQGDDALISDSSSVFYYSGFENTSGRIVQRARLVSSDAGFDFGGFVSLSEDGALVGASSAGASRGEAYLFRHLFSATGTVMEDAKLLPSDGENFGHFGSVALSGSNALVGATGATIGEHDAQGAAYLYHHLDTAGRVVTEDAKLTVSDGHGMDNFGAGPVLQGGIGLIGATSAALDQDGELTRTGAVYLFRGLDTAIGNVTENAKLIASDGSRADSFGGKISLSGSTVLVSAAYDNVVLLDEGAVYVFCGLNTATATGTITETVKLIESSPQLEHLFGRAVGVDGDHFLIGAPELAPSKAYTGTVSAVTTLDAGGASGAIDGISFISRVHWVIGETTDDNEVTLTAGDSATLDSGKFIYIGKKAGSDGNTLVVAGTVSADVAFVGSRFGNAGNVLQLEATAAFKAQAIRLANGNRLLLAGTPAAARNFLQKTPLQVWVGDRWQTVTPANYRRLVQISQESGFTVFVPVAATPSPRG